MPLTKIESPDDPRIAPYLALQDRHLRLREGKFIAEGELVVRRLLESRYEVESLLVAESQVGRLRVPAAVPVYWASVAMLESIVGFRFHRGVLGCGIRSTSDDWCSRIPPLERPATVVVCCGVRDAENLGGILRSCAAFGVDLVVLGNGSADPLSRRVLRVSMATCLNLNLYQSPHLEEDLDLLRTRFGIALTAAVLNPAAERLRDVPRPRRLGLVLGNELTGVAPSTLQRCQRELTIPMRFQTDSLNVAVAAGIFLYHFSQVAD